MAGLRIVAATLTISAALAVLPTVAFGQAPLLSAVRNGAIYTAGPSPAPASQTPSLADILDKLDWDPQTRGPLLIVSPEETYPWSAADGAVPVADGEEDRPASLEPMPSGIYKTATVAAYFDRRSVRIGTLTVLAPRSMTVLNYEHLPKPDPYAGMSPAAKLRLLLSTLTDSQWATAGSEEGIGAADLDEMQSVVFLSLLPQPFLAIPMASPDKTDPNAGQVELTNDQRAATRLRLEKRLEWTFPLGGNRSMNMGSESEVPDPGFTFRRPYQPGFSISPVRGDSSVFGVALTRVVANRPKPSQLPTDWAALEVQVPLKSLKTIGDLISRIARQTGAKLYCDPRYASRTLVLRGSSAQANDLLAALCCAVTGTWRRLGDTFVLTDDLVGLGVRHVRIDDWIEVNTLLSLRRDETARRHAVKHSSAIGWSSTDPFKPDADLIAKLNAFDALPPVPLPGSGPTVETPLIPVTDLPAAAQEKIRAQMSGANSRRAARSGPLPSGRAPQSDAVRLGIRVRTSYIVPGLGRMVAPEFQGVIIEDLFAKSYLAPVYPKNETPDVATLWSGPLPAARALLINAKDLKTIGKLAAEARRRGLNQLWVVVPTGDTRLLTAAIAEGAKNGITVQAVVRLLRVPADSPSDSLDKNLLGETSTEYVERRRRQVTGLPSVNGPFTVMGRLASINLTSWQRDGFLDLFRERGNFRKGTTDERQTTSEEMARIAAVPGLAGIVIQDKAAPGSEPPSTKEEGPYYAPLSPDFGMQMGYDDATRLDCLKQLGFDPADLSPLPYGDQHWGLALPFFPDSGGVTQQAMAYATEPKPGDKSLWTDWTAFRHARSVALVEAVTKAVRAQRADLPILISRYDDPTNGHYNWYGSFDKPVVDGATRPIPPPKVIDYPNGGTMTINRSVRERANDESRVNFLPIPLGGVSSFSGKQTVEESLSALGYLLKESAKWDGLVIDVSNASTDEALAILALIPSVRSNP